MDPEIFEILKARLHLSKNAMVNGDQILKGSPWPIPAIPDWIIEDGGNIFFVEIVSTIKYDEISRMLLFKEIFQPWITEKTNLVPTFVIAGGRIPDQWEIIAEKVGITTVLLPTKLTPLKSDYSVGGGLKITSDKSWRVISRLLKEGIASIRQLSILEKVSYGWAHKTIQRLISQGIVTRTNNYVRITDANRLLNSVAWERPFENLRAAEIYIDYDDAIYAAKDISHALKKEYIKFAFTNYTAGGLYTNYAIRHDAVYLYLVKNEIDVFKAYFGTENQKGIKALIYVPDRDVFDNTREIESIIITSPSQTLLDLAGLGYSGLDIAKVMVESYARI